MLLRPSHQLLVFDVREPAIAISAFHEAPAQDRGVVLRVFVAHVRGAPYDVHARRVAHDLRNALELKRHPAPNNAGVRETLEVLSFDVDELLLTTVLSCGPGGVRDFSALLLPRGHAADDGDRTISWCRRRGKRGIWGGNLAAIVGRSHMLRVGPRMLLHVTLRTVTRVLRVALLSVARMVSVVAAWISVPRSCRVALRRMIIPIASVASGIWGPVGSEVHAMCGNREESNRGCREPERPWREHHSSRINKNDERTEFVIGGFSSSRNSYDERINS